jgi:hypothetical protein
VEKIGFGSFQIRIMAVVGILSVSFFVSDWL